MASKRSSRSRFLGNFDLAGEASVIGQLRLRGSATSLEVHADRQIGMEHHHAYLTGHAYTGELLTLIDCSRTSMSHTSGPQLSTRYTASIYPSYVAVGRHHFDPGQPCIESIQFSTTDLHTLFHDYHAFGTIHDSRGDFARLLGELKEDRAIPIGEAPTIAYFTGKYRIAEAITRLGKVSVNHSLSYNFGGPSGVHLRNRMYVAIEPEAPMTFVAAIEAMTDVALFLSVGAGRGQGITRIHVGLASQGEKHPAYAQVHMSFPWKVRRASDRFRPHPADVPLRPIEEPEEFQKVLTDWLARQPEWRIARHRYLSCLRKANTFGSDRLITAANMFDLLPMGAVPEDSDLSPEMAQARETCRAAFRDLPDSPERSSALSAMGRLGSASLPKKVLHRVAMLEPTFGRVFPDLGLVATTAVKVRNVYVHGRSKDFDIDKVEPFTPFLTEALEFVFGASDLLQAGWNSQRWLSGSFAGRHSFSRFLDSYRYEAPELKRVLTSRP